VVTICTTCFNIQLCILYLWVSYDSQCKQGLFPSPAFSSWTCYSGDSNKRGYIVRAILLGACTPNWFWFGSLRHGLCNGTASSAFTDQITMCCVTILVVSELRRIGGLVVSVLATGPKVRGFKPGRGRWILRVIKSAVRLRSEGK
jgi:hypothetical protein